MLTNYENLIGEIQTNQQKEELDLDSLIFHLNKLKLYWLATDQHLKSGYDLNQTIYYQIFLKILRCNFRFTNVRVIWKKN